MKFYKIFIIMTILSISSQTQAYIESFLNHTNKTIAIGMKYKGSKDLEFIVLKPHEKQQFEPGTEEIPGVKSAIDNNKINSIPHVWSFIINPSDINEANKNKQSWTILHFIWLTPEAYKVVLAMIKATNENTALSPEAIRNIAFKTTSSSDVLSTLASVDYNLTKFITTIGKTIGQSMARTFHTDIIEDENGDIRFITQL